MRLPGFTAPASLAGSGRHLPGRVLDTPEEAGLVVPASYWGEFQSDACTKQSACDANGNCVGNGLRQYSAILWGIPWGRSWEAECNETPPPAVINGVTYPKPSRCVNTGFNMWGQFDVPDSSCPCGNSYRVCWQRGGSSCDFGSISACSLQKAYATCAQWGCKVNSSCNSITGRCT